MQVITSAAFVGWMMMSMLDRAAPQASDVPGSTPGPHATPAVLVIPFDTDRTAWMPPAELGATVADLIAHALVDSGRYRVLDREWIEDEVMQEQASSAPPSGSARGRAPEHGRGRVPISAWRNAASRSGVRYLITGAVTRFTNEQARRSIGGGALRVLTLGGYRRESTATVIELSLRMIDLETGEVVASALARGESGRKNVSVGALGLIGLLMRRPSLAGGGFSAGSRGSRDAMLSEALAEAADRGAQLITIAAGQGRVPGVAAAAAAGRSGAEHRPAGLPVRAPVR